MTQLDFLRDEGIIDASLGRLKSGKEADVYLVERGGVVLVAKVYKDRAQRSFKNNAAYKEGRKTRGSRTRRAIESRSKYGREAEEDAWKSAEADALFRLHANGVRVPEPVMFYGGVLLMHLAKDSEGEPAARLIDVTYDAAMARRDYVDLRGQMIQMLCCQTIHGDLSPYNILAAEAGPTIIDFPQIVSAAHSSRASFFFQRDFENVLRFLARAEPSLSANISDGRQIWQAYQHGSLSPDFVPSPPQPRRDRSGVRGSASRGGQGRTRGGQGRAGHAVGRAGGGRPRDKNRRPQRSAKAPQSRANPAAESTTSARQESEARNDATTPSRRRRRRRRRRP